MAAVSDRLISNSTGTNELQEINQAVQALTTVTYTQLCKYAEQLAAYHSSQITLKGVQGKLLNLQLFSFVTDVFQKMAYMVTTPSPAKLIRKELFPQACPNAQQLELEEEISITDFNSIISVFPNLTQIKIADGRMLTGNDYFQLAERYPNLQVLDVRNSINIDKTLLTRVV